MSEQIAYLPAAVADVARLQLRELDSGDTWKLTRLLERAFAAGYEAAYMRGYQDGYARGRAEALGYDQDERS